MDSTNIGTQGQGLFRVEAKYSSQPFICSIKNHFKLNQLGSTVFFHFSYNNFHFYCERPEYSRSRDPCIIPNDPVWRDPVPGAFPRVNEWQQRGLKLRVHTLLPTRKSNKRNLHTNSFYQAFISLKCNFMHYNSMVFKAKRFLTCDYQSTKQSSLLLSSRISPSGSLQSSPQSPPALGLVTVDVTEVPTGAQELNPGWRVMLFDF